MKKIVMLSIMLPLLFGFLFLGGGSSGGGFVSSFQSSNKVIAPAFLNIGGGAVFAFRSNPFRPTFQPVGPINIASSFRWNFFDP